ncbi:MAG: protease inhibitor I42 family protein [Methanolinea sp.]|jgi:inhibitor of cysteine peptidase|nr:protease inhibitor I42 family protein [Methanolinea sp.]
MSQHQILFFGVALACLLAVFLAGCTQPPEGPGGPTPTLSPTATTASSLSFDQNSNGKNVTVPLGSELSLTLPENPTTGYSWNLSHSAGLALVKDAFTPPATQLVGAGGTHSWVLSAKEKGGQMLHGEYRRPWVPAGTVTYLDLEGGFYGIVGDDGRDYLPLNLDAQYRVDGMRVAFEEEEAGDIATIQMWGIAVNITFMDAIETYDLHVLVN